MSHDPNAFPPNGDERRPEELAVNPSPLDTLGGYEDVRQGVAYLTGLMEGQEPAICTVVVKGASIQPCGLPSILLGPSESAGDIYDEAKRRVMAAIMRGNSEGATANLHCGAAALSDARKFLGALLGVIDPELSPDQRVELQALLADKTE